MIVDDDPVIRQVLDRHFSANGWDRGHASGIEDGLVAFSKSAYDLVLVDYVLKDGDGRDFVQGVREKDLDVPILVVSGELDLQALTAFVREAIDDTLGKPIQFDRLKEAAKRLLRLGRERRRNRKRASVLLEISSQLSVGGRSQDLLQRLIQTVPEITPYRRTAMYIADEDSRVAKRVVHMRAQNLPETASLDELVRAFDRGFKLNSASFVPGSRITRPTPPEAAFSEGRARRFPAESGDHGLVEIRSSRRLWGYLSFEDPEDGLRPSEDSMRLLSLLAASIATVLENSTRYDSQALLRARLEMVRDVVHKSLERADLDAARKAMTQAAVTDAGYSFAAFLERRADGTWVCEAPCPRLDAGHGVMREFLDLQTTSTERGRFLEFNRQSFLLGRSPRVSIALPVFVDTTFKGFFVVEDDTRDAVSDTDRAAFQMLCDQMGLLRKRIEHEQELERKTAELQSSYSQLESMHDENVRMQEVLKRYVPPSTWEKVDKGGDVTGIEEVVDRAVMFVDMSGFTRIVESSKPAQTVALLNAYFTAVAAICYQHGGEIVKYIGDGIMGFFREGPKAITAVQEILAAQAKISAQIAEIDMGPIQLRVGVAWGPVIVTSVGPFYQQDRTILGDTVNTASRLEQRAVPGTALFDSALIGAATPESLGLASAGLLTLRGKRKPVTVFTFQKDRGSYTTGSTGEIVRQEASSLEPAKAAIA